VIHLESADRVRHARELVLAGLEDSDASRRAYLAETDDDREWVPNPRQHSHPIPLEVDDRLYATWTGVVADVRDLMDGKRGLGLRELATAISPELTKLAPDAFIDVGRMFSEPTDITLGNGLRLIVQPESISDTISVYGRVKNRPDLQVPPGKEGTDQILRDLFSYGSVELDRLAFQEALDKIGAKLHAGTSFSLEVLPDAFARGVELLADNLLHPALPETAFKAVQQRTRQAVAGQLQSPIYRSGRAFLKAIYPENDPTQREATPESVASLTLSDVRQYNEQVFRPDLTTIVVIGKVTPEQARTVIEKYFGAWKAAGQKPETDLPPVPRNKIVGNA